MSARDDRAPFARARSTPSGSPTVGADSHARGAGANGRARGRRERRRRRQGEHTKRRTQYHHANGDASATRLDGGVGRAEAGQRANQLAAQLLGQVRVLAARLPADLAEPRKQQRARERLARANKGPRGGTNIYIYIYILLFISANGTHTHAHTHTRTHTQRSRGVPPRTGHAHNTHPHTHTPIARSRPTSNGPSSSGADWSSACKPQSFSRSMPSTVASSSFSYAPRISRYLCAQRERKERGGGTSESARAYVSSNM